MTAGSASQVVVGPAVDPVALWRAMVTLRAFDERAVILQRQGRIGTYPLFWGEEGVQAGAVVAVRDTDWLFPSYRQSAVPVLRGMEPEQVYLSSKGDPRAFFDPHRYACAPPCVPIATHLPHAVGWAWGRALEGRDDVAVAFIGDGGTSEGDFHEAMNLAGVRKAAVVFVCTNNQWALSTPVSRQTGNPVIAEKAAAYGMPGVRVDGYDAIAVAAAVSTAAERARRGEGPTLVEAFCYRIGAHGTADDPALYRNVDDALPWREKEPIGRLERLLIAEGRLGEAEAEAAREEAKRRMLDAGNRLGGYGPPDRSFLIRHVLAEPPPSLVAQLEEAGR